MDRLKLTLAGCGLSLLLTAPGCKTPRSEVPPGRAYNSDGRQAPPSMFSSEPKPMVGAAPMPGAPGSATQFGTPPPATGNLGAPTAGQYGPPGTAGSAGGLSGLVPPPGGFNDPLASRASATSPSASAPAPSDTPAPSAANSTYYVPKKASDASNGATGSGYSTPGMTGPMFESSPK